MRYFFAGLFLAGAICLAVINLRPHQTTTLDTNEVTLDLQSVSSPAAREQTFYIISIRDNHGKVLVSADRLAKEALHLKSGALTSNGHGIWSSLPKHGKKFSLRWRGLLNVSEGTELYLEVGKSVVGSVLDVKLCASRSRLDLSVGEVKGAHLFPLGVVSSETCSSHRRILLTMVATAMIFASLFIVLGGFGWLQAVLLRRHKLHCPKYINGKRAISLMQTARSFWWKGIFWVSATVRPFWSKDMILHHMHLIALVVVGFCLYAWYPKPSSINSDPESAYVANCILMAQGLPITHSDHPGTTTQLFGAVLARFGGFRSENIVARYDQFRVQFCIVLFAGCAALWLAIIRNIRPSLIGTLASFACGFLCFMGRENVFALQVVSAESSLLLTGLLALALLSYSGSDFRWSFHVTLALVAGFALAAKISALPFCVGLMIVSSANGRCRIWDFISRCAGFGLLVAGCFVSIIYLTGVIPRFVYFMEQLLQHKGIQGKGAVRTGLGDFLPGWGGVLELWTYDQALMILTGVAVLTSVVLIVVRWRSNRIGSVRVVGWLIAIFGSFLPLIEHVSWRYFLLGIMAIIGMLLLECLKEKGVMMRIVILALCFFVALPAWRWAKQFPTIRRAQEEQFVQHSALLSKAIIQYRPDLLGMGFSVNVSLGFVQLLTSYHDQHIPNHPSTPLLDPHRQYGVELGSYLPWSGRICAQGRTIDPLTRSMMIVTAVPITGSLQSQAHLRLTAPSKRLYIYTFGKSEEGGT